MTTGQSLEKKGLYDGSFIRLWRDDLRPLHGEVRVLSSGADIFNTLTNQL